MEDPSREWGQALAGIEPVRFEFPYENERLLHRGRVFSAVFYVLMFGPMIVWSVLEGFAFPAIVGAICLAYSEFVVAGWYQEWTNRLPEVVVLEGLSLTIVRHGFLGHSEERYRILEIHDLRVSLGDGGRYRAAWPLPRVHRAPVYESSEPIRFTCRHGGYSFGGYPLDRQTATQTIDRIVEYDAALRAHLGMPAEPNITTYDRERVADAMKSSWDVDVPYRALW